MSPVAPAPGPPPGARTGLVWGCLGLAVVLILTAVWALGGFRLRHDRFVTVPAGTTITAGPYELTFTSATSQYRTTSNDYEVVALGTGRTTKDSTIAAPTGDSGFIYAQNPTTKQGQTVRSFNYGDATDPIFKAQSFTPGLAPIRFSASFIFTAPPSDRLVLAVFDQEFADKFVFGDDDPTWNTVRTGHQSTLAVKRLPDRPY